MGLPSFHEPVRGLIGRQRQVEVELKGESEVLKSEFGDGDIAALKEQTQKSESEDEKLKSSEVNDKENVVSILSREIEDLARTCISTSSNL